MKVLKARVYQYSKPYANRPYLEVLVDAFPDRSQMRYTQKGQLYYAELEGCVSFFSWRGEPDTGYGGQCFPITLVDGTQVTLIGPWSSRPGVMNRAGFGPCVDVSITDDPRVFERGFTFYTGHITLELADEAARLAGTNLICHLERDGDQTEFTFVPYIGSWMKKEG